MQRPWAAGIVSVCFILAMIAPWGCLHRNFQLDFSAATAPCSKASDCVAPCFSSATCDDGICVLGDADRDLDNDGLIDLLCPGGTDCDDSNATCGSDCVDDDGDGVCRAFDCDDSPSTGGLCVMACELAFRDADGDSYGNPRESISSCQVPSGYVSNDSDCADTPGQDPDCGGLDGSQCNPGWVGQEACDGVDNNCDGVVDVGCSCHYLNDPDGICATAFVDEEGACQAPSSWEADEVSCDGINNDCDSVADEGCACAYLGKSEGVCGAGSVDVTGTCVAPAAWEATEDSCDGLDNDCDTMVDEGCSVSTWWDSSWAYRRTLALDNSAQPEALINFPVLVVLEATSFDYSRTTATGSDLRFVDADDSTVLSFEIERWNPSGRSEVWVRVPRIAPSSTSDGMHMYYGNPAAADGQDSAGVFDSTYAAVWHFSELSGEHVDVVGGIVCTGRNGLMHTMTGVVGRAASFNGTCDAYCGQDQVTTPIEHTITAWVNLPLSGTPEQQVVALEKVDVHGPFPGLSLYVRRSDGALGRWVNDRYFFSTQPSNRVVAGAWNFLAIRGLLSAAGSVEVSRNGGTWEQVYSGDTQPFLVVEAGTPLVLGRWTGPGRAVALTGELDEVRISRVQRSEAWIRAQYLSQDNRFVTLGEQQQQ